MAPTISLKQFMASGSLKERYLKAASNFNSQMRTEEKEKLDKMDTQKREEYIKDAQGNAARFKGGTIFDDIYKQYK